MTVDREQIREYATLIFEDRPRLRIPTLSRYCLRLLDELEEAEARLAKVPALVEALRPFAEHGARETDEHGWTSPEHHASISTWFGPSEFHRATKAISGWESA